MNRKIDAIDAKVEGMKKKHARLKATIEGNHMLVNAKLDILVAAMGSGSGKGSGSSDGGGGSDSDSST